MENNIEYNFVVTECNLKDDLIVSFKYNLSIYYKDDTPGYSYKEDFYHVNTKFNTLEGVEDIIDIVLKLENVDNIFELSFFKESVENLNITKKLCQGNSWSLTNVSKFE
jgi:hypothetical protein